MISYPLELLSESPFSDSRVAERIVSIIEK